MTHSLEEVKLLADGKIKVWLLGVKSRAAGTCAFIIDENFCLCNAYGVSQIYHPTEFLQIIGGDVTDYLITGKARLKAATGTTVEWNGKWYYP
jgi:hypothetical protein